MCLSSVCCLCVFFTRSLLWAQPVSTPECMEIAVQVDLGPPLVEDFTTVVSTVHAVEAHWFNQTSLTHH